MTEEARAARNAYLRKWRKENPEKVKKIRERYWEKKVQERQAGDTANRKEVQDCDNGLRAAGR